MDNITKSHIRQIQQAMRQNKLVIFAGAGVSKSAGVPLWGELIDELKKELDLPQYETDFLKIPQLYKNLRKGKEYLERIKEILMDGCVLPNKIHESILDLKPCHIVTTNYDDLFEQAIANSNSSFFTVSKDEDLPFNRGEKLLIKMHGDFKSGNIVLTENDYLDYEKNFPLIRSYLMSIFASKLILFVGFSFSDINLKFILRDVRKCLGEKMQPVYMLSAGEDNVHVINYFDDNLVNLVQIGSGKDDPDLKEMESLIDNKLFDDEKSKILYKQLIYLRKYNESQNDFFSLFDNFLNENIEQFHHLGKYIKYVFPSEFQRESYLNDGVFYVPPTYTKSVKKLFEDSDDAKAYKDNNKDRLQRLMDWLNINGVEEIKDVGSVGDFIDKSEHNTVKDELTYIYDLDIKKVSAILEERSNKPLSYTKDDLLYPYMLCLLGRYKEAYDCYKRLHSLMVAKKKFVLAFICRYNMRSLYGPVMHEISNWDKDIWFSLNKEIGRIDVQDALVNMPIDGPLRVLLSDLSNGKYFADRFLDSNEYKLKLRSQYEESLKGGISINRNILHILWIADEIVDFDHNNYIFNEPFAKFRSIFLNILEGVFYSVLTKDGEFGSSKLKCLYDSVADLLFYLQPNDLGNLLEKIVGRQRLPVNDSFMERIKQWLDNLYEISENGQYKQKIFSRARIGDIILNILWLSLYTEPQLDLPNIYSLIKEYWFDARMMTYDKLLNQFCLKYTATSKEAIGILENILHSNVGYTKRLDYAVANLCGCVDEANEKLEELISVKQIQHTDNIQYIASFCRVATDDVKKEIIAYLRENVKSLYQLLVAERFSNKLVMTPELLRKLKDTFKTKDDNILFAEEYICSNLKWIYEKSQDNQLKKAIDECFSENDCYKFLRNPELYDGLISDIPGSWYLYVEDDVLKRLVKNSLAVHNIKDFCKDYPYYAEFKEKIWNLL